MRESLASSFLPLQVSDNVALHVMKDLILEEIKPKDVIYSHHNLFAVNKTSCFH